METIIKRPSYIEKLLSYKDKNIIKVLTGIRRCGKSYILFSLFCKELVSKGIDETHIIKINLESIQNIALRNAETLYNFIKSQIKDDKKYYILIDEIQLVKNFEDVVNGINTDFNTDVYITGSNSRFLSSDISTTFRGRAIEIEIYPLSFEEFYNFRNTDKKEALNEYILYGGLPYVALLEDRKQKEEYLSMINSTVIYRDIIERYNVRQEVSFDGVVNTLFSSIGSFVSSANIANTLVSKGIRINNETVSEYIKHLEDAFAIYKARRFDIKGKSYLVHQGKYYVVDMGIRNSKLEYRQIELSHIIENLVYMHLKQNGYTVDVGKNNNKEIDFIARKSSTLLYIQVCVSLESSAVKARELNSFSGLDDGYRKIVITLEENPLYKLENGYINISLIDFLLKNYPQNY